MSPVRAWLNGQPSADPSLASRGLQYGDGIFRTCLIFNGQVIDFDLQIAKALADAQKIRLRPPAAEQIAAEIRPLASTLKHAVLKLILVRRSGARGYRPEDLSCDRILLLSDVPDHPQRCWSQGVRAFRCHFTLAEQPLLAGIKHLNRLEQVMASLDWDGDADEGILCDGQQHPISGTRTNLFWVRDRRLFTPALDRCGVAGVMRAKLLDLAKDLGIDTHIARMGWDELEQAEEWFLCNSLIGLWPIRDLAGQLRSAPGPVTQALMRRLNHPRVPG